MSPSRCTHGVSPSWCTQGWDPRLPAVSSPLCEVERPAPSCGKAANALPFTLPVVQRSGFRELVPVNWMRMFGPGELQTLISGSAGPVDLRDLRAHTHYAGGYDDHEPYIEGFWRVLEGLEEGDKRKWVDHGEGEAV